MATLFNSEYRKRYDISKSDLIDVVKMLKETQKETGVPFDAVVKIYEITVSIRKIDAYIDDGDMRDVQQSGWAELFKETQSDGFPISILKEE